MRFVLGPLFRRKGTFGRRTLSLGPSYRSPNQ
jgi:hypothetical protein